MSFHPVLSPSPLEKAFCYVASGGGSGGGFIGDGGGGFLSTIHGSSGSSSSYRDNGDNEYCDDDNATENDFPPFWLSPPEVSLLQSAEENPLEYTLAETDDAVSYVRILLKMVDQVSTATNTTTVTAAASSKQQQQQQQQAAFGSDDKRILTLDTPVFSEDEAFDLYYSSTKQYKRLVVAHYCVTKIYEIICVSLDSTSGIPSVSELFHGRDNIRTTNNDEHEDNDPDDDGFRTIHLEQDDWRPLLKIVQPIVGRIHQTWIGIDPGLHSKSRRRENEQQKAVVDGEDDICRRPIQT
jgi:hypothetical protein